MLDNKNLSEIKSFVSKHYMYVLIAVAVLVTVVVLFTSLSHSNFAVSNSLNYGANSYIKFVSDQSSDDKYKWVEEEKVDLNTLIPEYNFRSGVVDYKFGDQVYDSDAAVVEDHPIVNINAPKQVTALLPSSQVNVLPVIETAKATMVPAAPPSGETVVVNIPSSEAASPPVIVPSQPGVPVTVVAPVTSQQVMPAVSTFRSAYY